MIAFATTMWALIMMLGIPLVLFSFLGATILGGEITDGQILLEITRVYSRKKLIIGKFLSVSLVVLLCYLLNILLSSLFYMLFVANSSHGTGVKLHFMDYSIHLMLESITGVFFFNIDGCFVHVFFSKLGKLSSSIVYNHRFCDFKICFKHSSD